MIINVERSEGELKLIPLGRIDSTTSGELEEALKKEFGEEDKKLVLDFESVDFISSKGLRVIVSTYKSLGDRKMGIINANASVREVFSLSGLLKIMDVK